MRNLLLVAALFFEATLVLGASSTFARPSKVVIGLEAINSDAVHVFSKDRENVNVTPNQKDTSEKALGYGASLGYIAYYKRFVVFPEIFYDQINSNAADFFAPESDALTDEVGAYSQDEISINYRYGARMNLGYSLYKQVDLLFNAGLARVDFDVRWKHPTNIGSRRSYGSSVMSPVFGLGLLVKPHKNFMLRLSYDIQSFDITYMDVGHTDSIDLKVARLGFLFAF